LGANGFGKGIGLMKDNNTLNILLIGRLPPPLGGTTVLCAQLVRELYTHPDVDVEVINTTGVQSFMPMIKVFLNILSKAPKFDVISLHATNRGALRLGHILWCICKVYRKPLIIRLFGGFFDQKYTSLPKLIRWLTRRTVLNADLCLFETKHLVQYFAGVANKPVWYPNSRPIIDNMIKAKDVARRFVFVSHVIATKGVREIITAGEQLNPEITVDIYGPFRGDITEQDFAGLKVVRYCGVLEPQEVISTLQTYDVLLLPSYWEGYSGVILEAYSAGIPVISTQCGGTPEIVDETSGILIEPKDPEQLLAAMKRLMSDDKLYQSLCRGVAKKREFFSSERWTNEFVILCKSVLKHGLIIPNY